MNSNQFPQRHKPKVEVWQLYDTKAKCRVTFGSWVVCNEQKKKTIPNSHLKIIPNK